MATLGIRVASLIVAVLLTGCAALITGSGTAEADIIHAGTTEAQLVQRLGPALRKEAMLPPQTAWNLREKDSQVSLLVYPEYGFDPIKGSFPIPPPDVAVSRSVFRFSGRVGTDTRAVQPSFDSFMTLGVAEIFLMPKALIERAREQGSELVVWFSSNGRAVAYRWVVPQGPTHG